MSLRALPLKISQGALPLDPTTFEKVDKTFNGHSYLFYGLAQQYWLLREKFIDTKLLIVFVGFSQSQKLILR